MADRTMDDIVKDLRKIAGDDTSLLIYIPGNPEPAVKTNVYEDVYDCPRCGSKKNYSFSCECGWYNPLPVMTVSC